MSTTDVLAAIDAATTDWAVGPDAMRGNGPAKVSPATAHEVTVALGRALDSWISAVDLCVDALALGVGQWADALAGATASWGRLTTAVADVESPSPSLAVGADTFAVRAVRR